MEILQQMLSPKQLGELVRSRREELRRSQKAIARQLQVSQTTLHKIETGTISTSRHLPRLFTLLGLPLERLDPIYGGSRVAVLDAPTADETSLVKISTRRRVLVLTKIEYEIADHYANDSGSEGRGIVITWTTKNGAIVSGLMDAALIQVAAREFHRVALALGLDLRQLPPDIPKAE